MNYEIRLTSDIQHGQPEEEKNKNNKIPDT
jgi:hypothetical protein